METAYEDYNKVKQETDLKKEFLEDIIEVIKKKCKEIELVKPKLDKKTKLEDKKYIVEKNKIISYPNEKTVYYGLCNMKNDVFKINKEYTVFQKPIEQLLNSGYIMDLEELIRDFDGWAWNVATEDIENYTYNLIYQNIKMLVGQKFLQDSIANMSKINFLDKLGKKIDSICGSEDVAEKIKEQIYIISIIEYIEKNQSEKENIEKEKIILEKKYNKISNKKEYLQEIANRKKQITKQIKELDEILSNNKKIKEKLKLENSKQNGHITIEEYMKKLQEKRKTLLKNFKAYGNLMKPMNYVKNKYNLKKKYDILQKIDLNSDINEQKRLSIIDLQINFLKAMQEKMGKTEVKKKIISYLYIIRYYKLLYFNKGTKIKDVEEIKEQLEMAEKYLITRSCNLKLINIFSNNIEKNYEIISKILDSNIIDLNELNVEFKKKDGKIILNVFDDNMIDKAIEYSEKDDINVKLSKKIKLFI
ncbi:MAG: hypothetical protein J5507_05745 [Clostridia bacterium]|nr:hypothetical protein [Clostridia bacterium]